MHKIYKIKFRIKKYFALIYILHINANQRIKSDIKEVKFFFLKSKTHPKIKFELKTWQIN